MIFEVLDSAKLIEQLIQMTMRTKQKLEEGNQKQPSAEISDNEDNERSKMKLWCCHL